MNDKHVMSLPRSEYDEMLKKIATVEERVGKLQAAHRLEVEKLYTQLNDAYKGIVVVFHEHPYGRGTSKKEEYRLHGSSPEFDKVIEGLVAEERKDDNRYKVQCQYLRKVITDAFRLLQDDSFGNRGNKIMRARKLMEDIPCG
jgi:hypothetical protein